MDRVTGVHIYGIYQLVNAISAKREGGGRRGRGCLSDQLSSVVSLLSFASVA
jgi:hypothetical protein